MLRIMRHRRWNYQLIAGGFRDSGVFKEEALKSWITYLISKKYFRLLLFFKISIGFGVYLRIFFVNEFDLYSNLVPEIDLKFRCLNFYLSLLSIIIRNK